MSKMPDPYTGLIAGGFAGGIAAACTSPLEILKTRLQSNVGQAVIGRPYIYLSFASGNGSPVLTHSALSTVSSGSKSVNYLKYILRTEGAGALFKGLSLSLMGSIPTRAIYFSSYNQFKNVYESLLPKDSAGIFLFSAMSAGIVTSTATCPLWMVKTQLQLNDKPGLLKMRNSIRMIYSTDGLRGFYRGLSASYVGSMETALYFVMYEKMKLLTSKTLDKDTHPTQCMLIAAVTKATASLICYPHEVCRTRLRQDVHPYKRRYHSFLQTLMKIWREEGRAGLYGGLNAHLLRAVPNTAIVFFSYEAIVRMLNKYQTLHY